MPTVRTAPQYLAIATLFAAFQPAVPAIADDGRNRSGFYVGGHAGYVFGNANATLADPLGVRRPVPRPPAAARSTARRSAACRRATSITSRRG